MKKLLLISLCFPLLFSCDDYKGGVVKYEVECMPAGFMITMINESGNISQRDIPSETATYSFDGKYGDFVSISAQADNENANISTKIYYKGKLIEESSSYGDYVIASVDGILK